MAADPAVKLAVLINAENAQSSRVGFLLAEIAKYGTAHVKRAYGDWTGTTLKGWKDQLLKLSIQPIQQFAYTQGKNATDAAMVIDAMDLLYTNRFDGFCIVSSDSDFTRLAARIRESGLVVYGFGERKTPKPFVAACDRFVYVENLPYDEELSPQHSPQLSPQHSPQADEATSPQKGPGALAKHVKNESPPVRQLQRAVEESSDDDGWAHLANVGELITKQHPDFDPRTYGYQKLSLLIAATPAFETTTRKPGDIFVRARHPTG